jgi:serine/threonine protein kinase
VFNQATSQNFDNNFSSTLIKMDHKYRSDVLHQSATTSSSSYSSSSSSSSSASSSSLSTSAAATVTASSNNNLSSIDESGIGSDKLVVAGFELGPVIGIGTYGEVRCAVHVKSRQHVAIKIVDLNRFEAETTAIMLKEIEILKSTNHPNCIRLLDVLENVSLKGSWCDSCACTDYRPLLGSNECSSCAPHDHHCHSPEETRDVMFLVQELAAGGELFSLLMHTGPLPEDVARHYFRQLIDAIEHLHTNGVVHRDLKPENLVLDARFQLKVVDFGLASFMKDDLGIMHSGVGSQPYSAPEVYYAKELFASQGYRGPPADVWSAAVILFVMLAGRPPFLRPLARTYNNDLRRCKHFINILKGNGYGSISIEAKDLLKRLFKSDPADRLTISEIRKHFWFNGPVPSAEMLVKVVEDRAKAVWMQTTPGMVAVLRGEQQQQIRRALDEMLPTSDEYDTDIIEDNANYMEPGHNSVSSPRDVSREELLRDAVKEPAPSNGKGPRGGGLR